MRPNRVGENVDARDLQQHGRVAEPRRGKVASKVGGTGHSGRDAW